MAARRCNMNARRARAIPLLLDSKNKSPRFIGFKKRIHGFIGFENPNTFLTLKFKIKTHTFIIIDSRRVHIMYQKISATGKKIVQSGLVEANFGNISARSASGNSFVITKTKTALDEINAANVVEIPIWNAPEDTLTDTLTAGAIEKTASSETPVHRRIYTETDAKTIIHAHCPYSVVMSILEHEVGNNSIIPIDSEGKLFLKEIPIISGGIGSDELAKNAADAFKKSGVKGVIILGHGTIAIGDTLEEAYNITAQLEHSAKIKYLYAKAKSLF